jgi:hypothetical protein
MSGYLDQYGAGEDQRNRIVLRSVIGLIVIAILATLGWYIFENHHQEGLAKQLVGSLKSGDYQAAYRAWGCANPAKDCSGYSFRNFMEDWGPDSGKGPDEFGPPDKSALALTESESCNNGVMLTVNVNPRRVEKLWIDRDSDRIGFSPWPICPHKSPYAIMVQRTLGPLRKPLLQ